MRVSSRGGGGIGRLLVERAPGPLAVMDGSYLDHGSPVFLDRFFSKVSIESVAHGCKWEATFNSWIKGGEDKGQTRPLVLVSGTAPTGPPPAPQPPAQQQGAVLKPGDDGVHPQVLAPDAFSQLPAMQAGDLQVRKLLVARAMGPGPPEAGI